MTPVVSSVFGRMFVAAQLEKAIAVTLIKWFPTYLHALERQLDLDEDSITVPKNYTNRNSFDIIPEEELPKVVIISPGTVGTPRADGSGAYMATWRVGIGVVHAASEEDEASLLTDIYAAAAREILLDKQALDESVTGMAQIIWTSESYDDLPIRSQVQKLRAASLYFAVDISNVATKWRGPEQPDQQPDSYVYPTVDRVFIDIRKKVVA